MQKRDIKINLACYLIRFRKKSAIHYKQYHIGA